MRARAKRPSPRPTKIPFSKQISRRAASLDQFYSAQIILERDGFLSGEQLASLLEKSEGKILPSWLNRHLVAFVNGKARRRKGRPRHVDAVLDFLLADHIEWFELKRAEFAKIPKAERHEDPGILAANYLVNHSPSLKKYGFSGRRLNYLFSRFGYLRRRPAK